MILNLLLEKKKSDTKLPLKPKKFLFILIFRKYKIWIIWRIGN